jgi:hypothetical protein
MISALPLGAITVRITVRITALMSVIRTVIIEPNERDQSAKSYIIRSGFLVLCMGYSWITYPFSFIHNKHRKRSNT